MKNLKQMLTDYGIMFLQYVGAFFAPIFILMLGIGVFTVFDWYTGIQAAKKKGEAITSAGYARTLTKFLLYTIMIISTRALELMIPPGFINIPFASLAAGFILVVNYKSIVENISTATGVDLWDFVKDKLNGMASKNNGPGPQ